MRVCRSSANARPWVASAAGLRPLLASDSMVSVAMPPVRSHFSGPGIIRSGGSASGAPTQTWTPWIRPSVICTTSVRITRSLLGVMLVSGSPARTVSPMADWMAIRLALRRRKVLMGTMSWVCCPNATTAGSAPRVSTRSQSSVMAVSLSVLARFALPGVGPTSYLPWAAKVSTTRRSTWTAPALSRGSFALPHLGDCTQEGQP